MRVIIAAIVALMLGFGAWWAVQPAQQPETRARVDDLQSADDTSKYARAIEPRAFVFPQDHGPHIEYQTEWWYYTGNMADKNGRHFGYQLTIFRRSIAPDGMTDAGRLLTEDAIRETEHGFPSSVSRPPAASWTTNQIYFAHFAVTDSGANKHQAFERLERGGADLAGASGAPFTVWIDDWRVDSMSASGDAVKLRASDGAYAIDLNLNAAKPVVKQGDDGLSRKSSERGNASYYYSFTRLASGGSISTPAGRFEVTGTSWMDHEWSTSALGKDAVGWDWFAIQLTDNREIMLYKLRNADGTYDLVSGGTLVEPDGSAHRLGLADFGAEPLSQRWRSPTSDADYPLQWKITLPGFGMALDLAPRITAQEMGTGSGIYWEGAITVRGTSAGKPVTGVGYLELTGYKGTLKGKV